MGDFEVQKRDQRRKSMEELRSSKVGTLLLIIDSLEEMNLSVAEVETVLRTCGLNPECAARFGASIRYEKENHYSLFDSGLEGPQHP